MYTIRTTLPDSIIQTYMLLTLSIASYLIGAYKFSTIEHSIFAIFASLIFLIVTLNTKIPMALIAFAFTLGVSHHHYLMYLNIEDPTIIHEALSVTMLIFLGLSIFAASTVDYYAFAFNGILVSGLMTLIWLYLFNTYYQNTLLEFFIIYVSIMIFTIYVVADTYNLLKNYHHGPIEHATELFLDFINIFINLVRLLRYLKKKN